MLNKKERTTEVYKQVAVDIKLLQYVFQKVFESATKVLPKKDVYKLVHAERKISAVKSDVEDRMFHDHPSLDNEYIRVFYSDNFNKSMINDIDKEMQQKILTAAENLVAELRQSLQEKSNP